MIGGTIDDAVAGNELPRRYIVIRHDRLLVPGAGLYVHSDSATNRVGVQVEPAILQCEAACPEDIGSVRSDACIGIVR